MKKFVLLAFVLLVGCYNKNEELSKVQKKYPNAIMLGNGDNFKIIAKDSNNRVIMIKDGCSSCSGFVPVEIVVIQ